MTQEVMEQVIEKIASLSDNDVIPRADAVLSIAIQGKTIKELIEGWASGKLLEKADDQSLPESRYPNTETDAYCWEAQLDMLKPVNGFVWVKVKAREEK